MKLLQRYIAKTIILATLLVAIIMSSIIFVMRLLAEMKNMGDGDYGLQQVILYIARRMPSELYQFSPMIILLGSIVGLSLLSADRELTVMRASGFYVRQIVQSVLAGALLLIVSISFVGEMIAPNWNYLAEVHKENARNGGQAVVTASGLWMHINNNFIHVQDVVGKTLLQGVTRYQFDSALHLEKVFYAKSLTKIADQWVMHDVQVSQLSPDHVKSEQSATLVWDIPLNANLLNSGITDPSELTFPKLKRFIRFLENNGLQSNEYRYNLWQRILQPLAALIMVFLSIPFVLSSLRPINLGVRIVIGLFIGFVFFIVNAMLGQVAIVYQLSPFLAAFLPLALFGLIGFVMLKQLVRR